VVFFFLIAVSGSSSSSSFDSDSSNHNTDEFSFNFELDLAFDLSIAVLTRFDFFEIGFCRDFSPIFNSDFVGLDDVILVEILEDNLSLDDLERGFDFFFDGNMIWGLSFSTRVGSLITHFFHGDFCGV